MGPAAWPKKKFVIFCLPQIYIHDYSNSTHQQALKLSLQYILPWWWWFKLSGMEILCPDCSWTPTMEGTESDKIRSEMHAPRSSWHRKTSCWMGLLELSQQRTYGTSSAYNMKKRALRKLPTLLASYSTVAWWTPNLLSHRLIKCNTPCEPLPPLIMSLLSTRSRGWSK